MATASSSSCVSADCSRDFLNQPPTLVGNTILLALFAVLIPIALALGIRYRGSVFTTAIVTGLALEVVGYIGRVLLHSDPHGGRYFAVFLAGTTLGPTCICGAMFLVVPRIVAVYGEEFYSWRPTWFLIVLSTLTAISFVLELTGSVVVTVRDASPAVTTGSQIIAVGLAIQLIALTIFVFHATLFAIALRTRQNISDAEFAPGSSSRLFRLFLAAFTIATILVVLRTSYRIVQIAEGFESSIAQSETLFLILDGAVMLLATILLLLCFPPRVLGTSWTKLHIGGLSREPLRPTRPALARYPISRPKPIHRLSLRSSASAHMPRKANCQALPQRDMVNRDNLW
ncbi:hypothetical protein GGS21DRAFT_334852 [Xylaria nigripes]|nr:hypothetical protein GGS21DRAFT_334852 [Xylaria nigripes]